MLALPALLESVADNKKWTLRECEDYAIANNISVKQSEGLTSLQHWEKTCRSDVD